MAFDRKQCGMKRHSFTKISESSRGECQSQGEASQRTSLSPKAVAYACFAIFDVTSTNTRSSDLLHYLLAKEITFISKRLPLPGSSRSARP